MSALHIVIGSGTIGGRVAKQLAHQGKQVAVVSRSSVDLSHPNIHLITADGASLESLMSISTSPKVVFNCANPPYDKWDLQWPPLAASVNNYVMKTGAGLVICSNLYGYGPYEGVLTEDVPLKATWKNGKVRADIWNEAKALHDAGSLRVSEVRGSDYLAANNQSRMGHRVIPNLLLGKPVQLLGELDQPHTWTDPDDVATLMIAISENDTAWGRPWHVPSNEPKTQRQVVADIARELDINHHRLRAVGVTMETLLGLANPMIRELNHTRYQFAKPFIMSSKQAEEKFGLQPKSWNAVIQDLVRPYLKFAGVHGLQALQQIGHQRLPE